MCMNVLIDISYGRTQPTAGYAMHGLVSLSCITKSVELGTHIISSIDGNYHEKQSSKRTATQFLNGLKFKIRLKSNMIVEILLAVICLGMHLECLFCYSTSKEWESVHLDNSLNC